jgi:two-component system sensor histidine kinase BaeS
MRFTIQRKVFLATFALATSLVMLLIFAMKWNLSQGFERYTAAAEIARLDWLVRRVEAAYAERGNWEFLRVDPERQWRRLSRPDPQGDPNRPPRGQRSAPPQAYPPQQPDLREMRPLAADQVSAQFGSPGTPPGPGPGSGRSYERPPRPSWDERPPPPSSDQRPPRQGQFGRPDDGGRPPQAPADSQSVDRPPPPPWEVRPPREDAQPRPSAEERPPAVQSPDSPPDRRPRPDVAYPRETAEDLPPPPGEGQPPPDALRIGPRLALLDADGKRLAGNTSDKTPAAERPIRHQGAVVGRLALQAAPNAATELDSAFLSSQTQNIMFAGLAALGLSLFAAWLLARHLLSPIHDLSDGARRIADGWLDARIPVRSDDELGELAYNFNIMAGRLAKIEESRRAWISDTSHELRTPLAVLRAEIEAMQDGVRSTDAATLARLHKQVQQLAKLVDDLRLTLDREPGVGDMEHTLFSPLAVLDEALHAFRERYATANILLETTGLIGNGRQTRGDAGRMTQVFTNLLENTLRYTDPGGRLRISARTEAKRLTLQFDDTAPAPPRSTLPRLFERFFRAEPSRSRALGGSGLGLAICKSLVEAHGGSINASLSELGGLAVRIELPLESL